MTLLSEGSVPYSQKPYVNYFSSVCTLTFCLSKTYYNPLHLQYDYRYVSSELMAKTLCAFLISSMQLYVFYAIALRNFVVPTRSVR